MVDVPIQVLVAGLPRLLADMVGAGLGDDPALTLVATADESVRPGSDALDRAILAHYPDALLVGMATGECDAVRTTQLRHPELAMVAVAAGSADAWTIELRPQFVTLESASPAEIRHALATAVESRRRPAPFDPSAQRSDAEEGP